MAEIDARAADLPRQLAVVVRPELLREAGGRLPLSGLLREALRWGIDDVVLLGRAGQDLPLDALAAGLPRAVRLRVSEAPAHVGTGGALNRACDVLARRFVLARGAAFPDSLGPALAAFARDGNRVDGRLLVRAATGAEGEVAVRLQGNRVCGFAPAAAGSGPSDGVDGGVALLERFAVDGAEDDSSFERGVLPQLAARGGLRATLADRWVDATEPARPRPALLLGWSGVLRAKVGTAPEGWSRGAVAAVRRATAAGWHVFALAARPAPALAAEIGLDGGTIDDWRADPAALLRDWAADPSRSVLIRAGGAAEAAGLPGVAQRGFLGGDLDALAAGVLSARVLAAGALAAGALAGR